MSGDIRYTKGEDTLLGGSSPQTENTAVFTATNATNILNDTAHGLSNGDCITIKTGTTLPTGLSADTYYYVINKADDTFQVALTPGGSAVTFSDDGTGTHTWAQEFEGQAIDVHLYRNLVLTFAVDSSPDLEVFIVGSQSDDKPTFLDPQAKANRYEFINSIDQEDAAAIAGDTGITLNAADVRQISINTDGLHWVTIKTKNYFGGDLSAYLKSYDNK